MLAIYILAFVFVCGKRGRQVFQASVDALFWVILATCPFKIRDHCYEFRS
jgi:hypothetical protein